MAAPDEPSHVVRAAAVVRGQLDGEFEPGRPTIVQVPVDLAGLDSLTCFRAADDRGAVCQQPLPPRQGEDIEAPTYAGQYPPLYYA